MAAVDIKISPENLLPWSNMEDWVNGASAAPTEHTLSGASATVAQESTIVKVGTYSAKVTRVGTNCMIYYDLPQYADFLGRQMTFGCWVYATVASRVRISLGDAVGTTTSSFHTGGSSWEYLEITRNIDTAGTRIRAQMEVVTGNTSGYFDHAVLAEGPQGYVVLSDISDVGRWSVANTYQGQKFKVARRQGLKMPLMQVESKSVQVEGMVTGSTPTIMRTNHDSLQEIINSFRTNNDGTTQMRDLYFFDDRFLRVLPEKNDPEIRAAAKLTSYSLRFTAPEAFGYSVNKTRSSNSISATPTSFTVSVLGNAISRPFIKVTNDTSNIASLTIENLTTGQKLSYTGSLVINQSLEIDTDLLTIENNDVADLANHTGDLDIILLPGDNIFKITGLALGTVIVDFFDRWL